MQTDAAARIARSLAMELAPDEHASHPVACDPVAYQAYLKGCYYWNKPFDEGLNEAIAFFERALAAAARALDIDRTLYEAHLAATR